LKTNQPNPGDNSNLFDWTYVGNVAHAHLLAADKLGSVTQPIDPKTMMAVPLPEISNTVPLPRLPTSKARPIGPAVNKTPELIRADKAFREPEELNEESRPVLRGRYDPLSPTSLEETDVSPLQVAGQAFFITNGEPLYFWDFPRAIWRSLGHVSERRRITIPRRPAMFIAGTMEWICWLLRLPEPQFTRFRVSFSCVNRWYNIEKARRVLGYTPIVGVQEGIEKYAQVWIPSQLRFTLFNSAFYLY
jgi:sterol-4alpha-carboxylate 3-dehydrogenase (decarboxylating)